ncbi:hypothetical protein SDJN03_04741, partial [Cucurbita argyrosperma subsp. sororia]
MQDKEQFTEEVRGEEGGWIWRNSGKENKRGKWVREKEGIKQKKANSTKVVCWAYSERAEEELVGGGGGGGGGGAFNLICGVGS